jgi:y4mF family transcriptional regulator
VVQDFAAELAAAVRGRRDALRLSQQDLADMAGVSERLVRFVEQGKPTLRLDTLLAVLETLGLELNLGIRARNAAQTLVTQPPSDVPPSAVPGNGPEPENRP